MLGCRLTKSPMRPANASMTATEMTMATTMTETCCAYWQARTTRVRVARPKLRQ